MSFFQISCLITALVSFLFGFFVFLNNRKSKASIIFNLDNTIIRKEYKKIYFNFIV